MAVRTSNIMAARGKTCLFLQVELLLLMRSSPLIR